MTRTHGNADLTPVPTNDSDSNLIGPPLSRFDGVLKVTGAARYAAEHFLPNLAQAIAVQSSIVRGRIQKISTTKALATAGVLDVITWQNAPRLCFQESNPQNRPGQTYLVLQHDTVLYQGQYIAIVIAETFEQARYASSLLEITYSEEPGVTDRNVAATQVLSLSGSPLSMRQQSTLVGASRMLLSMHQLYGSIWSTRVPSKITTRWSHMRRRRSGLETSFF